MFKLIAGEWDKLKSQKSFYLVIVAFLFFISICFILFHNDQSSYEQLIKKDMIRQANKEKVTDEYETDFFYNFFSEKKEKTYQTLEDQQTIGKSLKEKNNLFEIYDRVWFDLLKESAFFKTSRDNYKQIADRLGERLKHPLYRQDSYGKRSLAKQIEVFRRVEKQKLDLEFGDWSGFEFLDKIARADFVFLWLAFSLISISMELEEKQGIGELLCSTGEGIRRIIKAKTILICIIGAILTFIFYAVILSYGVCHEAFGPMERSIQSIERFHHSAGSYKIKDLLIIFLIWKIGLSIFISGIAGVLVGLSKNKSRSYLLLLLFILISFSTYKLIDPNYIWNFLAFFSLPGLSDSLSIFGRYQNLAIFGIPVARDISSTIFIVITTTLLFFVEIPLLSRQIISYKKKNPSTIIQRMSGKSLLTNEGLRYFVDNKAIIYLILFICLSCFLIDTKPDDYFSYERQYYLRSLRPLEGPVNKSTYNKIEEMDKIFEMAEKEAAEAEQEYKSGQLSQFDYYRKLNSTERILAGKEAYDQIKGQINKSVEEGKGANPVYLVDKKAEEFFLKNNKLQTILSISSSIIIFISIASLFSMDQKYGMEELIKTSSLGHRRVISYRIIFLMIMCLFLTIIGFIPYYFSSLWKGYCLPVNASIVSLPEVNNYGEDLSIATVFAGLTLLDFLSLFSQGSLILLICQISKSYWKKIAAYTLLILLPVFAGIYLKADMWKYMPWIHSFRWGISISYNGFNRMIIYILIQSAIIVLAIKENKRIWTKPLYSKFICGNLPRM